MRLLLLALLLGCSTDGLPPGGGGDLGSSSHDLAKVDLSGGPPTSCVSTCNRCAGGGCCGNACCNAGEWCDATQQCRCGTQAGCSSNQMCATGGPISPGGATCGTICCGDPQHPCPL